MKRVIVIVFALAICLDAAATAEVPHLLSYQGVLTDGAGVAVPDGPYNVTFRLYDSESGGTLLWSETVAVSVHKGIFGAMLGALQPFNLPFDAQYWLGMSIEGGAELSPRTQLASSAYSLNARSVNGDRNIFPSSGNVGIGTKSPAAPLHLVTDNFICAQIDGQAGGSWASFVLNAQGINSSPSYEYNEQNAYQGRTYLDPNHDWHLQLGADLVINARSVSGNVGIGVANPLEKLDVDGGIRVGRTASTNAGTMRWTGFDFEGYDGSSWKSFTAGGGSLPPGTAGQTLRNDGSSWLANDNLYNDGTNVGIGTTNPQFKLHVNGLARFDLATGQINVSTPGGWPGLIAYTENGNRRDVVYDNNGMYLAPSPSSSSPSATNGIVLRENGDIGIGTYDPTTKLHIADSGPAYATIESSVGFAPGVRFNVNGNTMWAILYHPIEQSLQFTKWTTEPLAYLTDDGRFILGPDEPAGGKMLEVHDANPTTAGHAAIAGYSYYTAPPSFGGAIGILGSHSDDGVGGVGVYGEGVSGSVSMPYQVGVYGYTNAGYGVYSDGTLGTTGAATSIVGTRDFGWRHTYAMQSPGNWFEDFGSARLSGGEASVALDPVFAQTVSVSEEYHVFLTPLGDCALYVAEKNEKGFVVKAVGGVATDVAFDYRIVAKRSGYETKRLEAAEDPAEMEQRLGVGRAMTARPQKRASGERDMTPVTGR